jgi:non-specific serine/threonine protein kinase
VLLHNLPAQLTSFVGRAKDFEAVRRLLAGSRSVTLCGPGGIGKTRLALAVAEAVVSEYPDGVWLAELASIHDGVLVLPAVAAVLKPRSQPDQSGNQPLIDSLRSRTLLLVLDNCEHVITAAAELAERLLSACPQVRILATSREPLRIDGESIWQILGLQIPTASAREPIEKMRHVAAVQLFVERSQSAVPAFTLTAENVTPVAEICRRLDGMPLAIELAAARVAVLTPREIAAHLDERLQLLVVGRRTAHKRQQTLRATLDWSYQLLTTRERLLFDRLSVFAGGWTLESVRAVCAGDDLAGSEILELLSSLVDKSLVLVESSSGDTRYRYLETVHQYASEHSRAHYNEAEELSRAHADYFITVGEQAESHLRGGRQFESWFNRLEREQDNLRAALRWCAQRREIERGLRLGGSVWRFWFKHDAQAEGREWLSLLLGFADSGDRTAYRAKVLNGAGVLALIKGDQATSEHLFVESLSIWRELGDDQRSAGCLHNLAAIARDRKQLLEARRLLEEALAIEAQNGDQVSMAITLGDLGLVLALQGDHPGARALHAQAVDIYERLDDDLDATWSSVDLACAGLQCGDTATARALFVRALMFWRNRQLDQYVPESLEGMAGVAAVQGDAERAYRLMGAASRLRDSIDKPSAWWEKEQLDGWLLPHHQRLAASAVAKWMQQGRALSTDDAVAYALDGSTSLVNGVASGSPVAASGLLTSRERQVAVLVKRGLSNQQIARQLVIANSTAERHVANILSKLGMKSRTDVAVWAVTNLPSDG